MTETNDFLDSFMKNLNDKYPPRYLEGVKKYKNHIVKDYTVEKHIDNIEQELFDALAYLHALRLIREQENGTQ